ncbi:MAG: CoA transferase, partial [Pseudomonadota bacterium]
LLGQPALAAAVRFERRADIEALVRDWMAGRSAEQAVAALRAIGAAAAVVATPADLLHHDAQLAARGFWQTLDHPVMGSVVYHGVAAAFSQTPTRYRSGAPLLGQHNDALARWMPAAPIKE